MEHVQENVLRRRRIIDRPLGTYTENSTSSSNMYRDLIYVQYAYRKNAEPIIMRTLTVMDRSPLARLVV